MALSTANIDPSQITNPWAGATSLSQLLQMGSSANADGMNVAPEYSYIGGNSGEDAYNQPTGVTGYAGVAPGSTVGSTYNLYDPTGQFAQTKTINGDPWWAGALDTATMGVLAAAGGYAAGGAAGLWGAPGTAATGTAAGTAGGATGGAVASPVATGVVNGVDLGTLDGAGAGAGAVGRGAAAAGDTAASLNAGIYGSMGDFGGTTATAGFSGIPGAAAAAAGGGGTLASLASSLGVTPGALLMGGGSLLSGLLGAGAAKSAAGDQAQAAQNALNMQQGMFNTEVGLEKPFQQAGVNALSPLGYGLGLSTDGGPGASAAGIGYGSLIKPFSMSDFQEDPGIQFQTQQGNLALQNSQAAKDGVLSGAALKDLIGYNSGMAAQGYQSAYDRYVQNQQNQIKGLMGVVNTGQSAASGLSNNATNMSNAMSGNITGIGNAQASGTVGAANALSGGVQGIGNAYLLSSFLNKMPSMGGAQSTSAGGYV